MIVKEIIKPNGKRITQLEPEDGYKWITNGDDWSTLVLLGKNDKIENWHDTNSEPPEEPEEPEEPATVDDYENALNELGVNVND